MAENVTYAVGDIHGRYDLLEAALSRIDAHTAGRRRRLIFLGDYVDRGPQSRQVLERLMALSAAEDVVCLKGNHEESMVKALTDHRPASFSRWTASGGLATMRSFDVQTREDALAGIPRALVAWMNGLPLMTADDHRIYVHAGLMPKVAAHNQSEDACLWIRERFLRAPARAFDAHVVHGHTPIWAGKTDASSPELLPHRTNLDTGAFMSGVLSVGVFDPQLAGGPREVLRIEGDRGAHSLRDVEDPEGELPIRRSLLDRLRHAF